MTNQEIWLIEQACEFKKINYSNVFKHTKKQEIVDARNIVMSILYHNTNLTCEYIAGLFDRTHAITFNAVKSCKNLCDTDKFYNKFYFLTEREFVHQFGAVKDFERRQLLAFDVIYKEESPETLKKSIARALVCH